MPGEVVQENIEQLAGVAGGDSDRSDALDSGEDVGRDRWIVFIRQ